MKKNELGNTYGRLVVIDEAESFGGKARWLCRCLCGNTKNISGDSLRQRKITSCGCFQTEHRKSGSNGRTHGMSKTPTYRTWQEMHTRCNDNTSVSYPNYGKRGIKICKRWGRFENFLIDMGVRPKGTSLDRINNNGMYSPKNCRWATRVEQNNKRRSCIYVKYQGRKQTIAQWCQELNLPYPRTYNRIVIQKLPINEAFERARRRTYKSEYT